jgi:hypothetical protein
MRSQSAGMDGSWSVCVLAPCQGEATFCRLDLLGSLRKSLLRGFRRLPNGLNGRGYGKALLQMLDLTFG